MGAAVVIPALLDGFVPATRNLREVDACIDLGVVMGEPRTGQFQVASANSFGFCGRNASLVLGRARHLHSPSTAQL
jgi:beta-ketoacyl ACP synthase